jgi:hypothetical protein
MPIFTLNISTRIKNLRYYFNRDNVNLTYVHNALIFLTSGNILLVAIPLQPCILTDTLQDGLRRIFSELLQNFHLPTIHRKYTETRTTTNVLKL